MNTPLISNYTNPFYFNAAKKVDKTSTSYQRKGVDFSGNVAFGSNPVKIAWLETLPNVSKSLRTQVKEFIPDTIKVHKEIFGIDKTVVNVPNVSPNSMVTKDIMPVTYPHLLLFRPYDNIYSLAEVANKSDFKNDFETTLNLLNKMYPKQDILFFEHGSGSSSYNSQIPKSAGKSVTFAHGHFCVMPEHVNNIYSNIVEDTKNILGKNNWKNIDENSIAGSDLIPQYKKLHQQRADYPPYLAMSYLNGRNNERQSLILLQENKQATTPSQLLRTIASKFAHNSDDATNWNYKTLLIKAHNGEDYSEFYPKIKEVREQDKIFENKFSRII